ncbi:MAG TPA: hypothetical protein DD706_18565 [Nitrospiraceae bacterium]|nr:hypothetical protein [Nitrospiraceae bacterium]
MQSYEIIELYRVLLDELRAALESHERANEHRRFYLNPSRIASLLARQSSNLAVMETLLTDLFDELRILDNQFAETYRHIIPGKFSILFQAEQLLGEGRLPLLETDPSAFPATDDGVYRTLWFSAEPPPENRAEVEQYLYEWNGCQKTVVDVSIHDGDVFFKELSSYFRSEDPLNRIRKLEKMTEQYRDVLLRTFTLEDLLTDIAKVRKHYGHTFNG